MWTALRPDPLLLSRRTVAGAQPEPRTHRPSIRAALTAARASRPATLALAHRVMVGVMSMTPVHMLHAGAAIAMVGVTISAHVACTRCRR